MKRLTALLIVVGAPVAASSPAAWNAEERAAMRACAVASGLGHARASAPIHFSDTAGVDVVRVDGRLRSGLRKAITMTCLYDRRSKRAEAVER